ncbi:hypothetical protein EFR52_00010, partial [Lactobacillus delbrueckii subsp. bulgaricus]|nr:hypothetical protein [Lactobacillus delbrueckii subsp. bulgaricus]
MVCKHPIAEYIKIPWQSNSSQLKHRPKPAKILHFFAHLDMTPEIRTLISGVIFMTKYTKEIKLAIYHEWVDDHRRDTYLSRKYGMGRGGIQYLVDLIQKHGEDILDRPQQKYTADFNANFPGFYNSSHTADRFSASRISFMHDFPEMRGSQ